MRCAVCGQRAPRGSQVCAQCGARLKEEAPAILGDRARLHLVPTLVLAALLLLVGLAGLRAAQLLQYAMRQATPSDVAAAVCTAFTTQNYDALLQRMDPRPQPPVAPGPFDARTLSGQLRGLDATRGVVTRCTYTQIAPGDPNPASGTVQFALTVQRARSPTASGLVLVLRRQANGEWRVGRESTFFGPP